MSQESGPIVIAGGSGFLGVSLAHHLARNGRPIVILSRRKPRCAGPWQHVAWDGLSLGDWQKKLDGADACINLAGRSVNCIKTPDHCDEILRSRVSSTRVLGRAMQTLSNPPPVWIQMSTAHIYGDPPEVRCDEQSPFGFGLAPDVGRAWEAACHESVLPEQRAVVLRTSFVIGRNRGVGGGALAMLVRLVRLGLGGTITSGQQGMSWIHETDLNRVFEEFIQNQTCQGTYVVSSPNPLSQREFMRCLRRALRMPVGLPASEWMVRLGAYWILRTDPELALYGRYVLPRRLQDEGFEFRFPHLTDALTDLL